MRKPILISLVAVLGLGVCLDLNAQCSESQALLRLPIAENPTRYRLSRSFAIDAWGNDIANHLVASCQGYIGDTSTYELYSVMYLLLDRSSNRFLFQDLAFGPLRCFGEHGFDLGADSCFRRPTSIVCEHVLDDPVLADWYVIFVSDYRNHRVRRFMYNWINQYVVPAGNSYGCGIFRPVDLDLSNRGTFGNFSDDFLLVLNSNSTISGISAEGYCWFNIGNEGSGYFEFQDPTAIACGRWPFQQDPFDPFANTRSVYVADAGNNRLVKMHFSTDYGSIIWDTAWTGLPGDGQTLASDIVDLDVDNNGHVWAVLEQTGAILKFTCDLNYLTQFGCEGFNENQFYHPQSVSNIGGHLACGQSYVVEEWTDSSGGQCYAIGTDVEGLNVSLYEDSNACFAAIVFNLIDFSGVTVEIFDESSNLASTIIDGLCMSDWHVYFWDGTDEQDNPMPSGDYMARVTASSRYFDVSTGEPTNTVVKEQWFVLCELGFSLASTSPAQNQLDVPDSSDVMALFDVKLDDSTVSSSSFLVHGQITGPHTGEISYHFGTSTITFDPDVDFAPGEEVTVTLTTSIESYFGAPMEYSYTWSFTVESEEAAAIYPLPDTCGVHGSTKSCIAADFNGDGYADIAAGCNDSGSCNVSVLMGNGDGTFSSAVAYPVGNCPYRYALTASDLNGDGRIDIATANAESHDVTILMNLGDSTFADSVCYPVGGICPRSIFAADLDGDGDNDLLTENWNSYNVSVLFNDGNGAFSIDSVYSMYGAGHSAIAADLDGDGDLDIAATNYSCGTVSVFPNRGDGTFEPYFVYPIGNGASSLAAADLDGDGDLDLATANMVQASTRLDLELDEMSDEPDSSVSVIFNDGDWEFSSPVEYQVGTKPTRVRAADLDGDGDMDLVSSNFDSYDVSILLYNGDGTFAPQRRYPIGDYPREVFAADFDSDGDLDLVAPNPEWTVSVILNHECGRVGDADGSGALDIDDVVWLIGFIFAGGPDPKPYPVMSGDADCSCEVNIDDVVYLINHIFLGGSPPCFCETWPPDGCGELR